MNQLDLLRFGAVMSSGTYTYKCKGVICSTAGTITLRTGGETDGPAISMTVGQVMAGFDIIGFSSGDGGVVQELH